jgi:hypothetical protein
MSTIDFWAERETGNREFFWTNLPIKTAPAAGSY